MAGTLSFSQHGMLKFNRPSLGSTREAIYNVLRERALRYAFMLEAVGWRTDCALMDSSRSAPRWSHRICECSLVQSNLPEDSPERSIWKDLEAVVRH